MQRDMDAARRLLLEIEKQPFTSMGLDIELRDCPADVLEYHIILLAEAGLIVAQEPLAVRGQWRAVRLTWQGHEFLDAARDDNTWKRASAALSRLGGFSMQLAMPLLIEFGKAKLREMGLLPPA